MWSLYQTVVELFIRSGDSTKRSGQEKKGNDGSASRSTRCRYVSILTGHGQGATTGAAPHERCGRVPVYWVLLASMGGFATGVGVGCLLHTHNHAHTTDYCQTGLTNIHTRNKARPWPSSPPSFIYYFDSVCKSPRLFLLFVLVI